MAERVGVKTVYIEPGSTWENGYVESINGKLRDKLLNGEIFHTLEEVKILIENEEGNIIKSSHIVLWDTPPSSKSSRHAGINRYSAPSRRSNTATKSGTKDGGRSIEILLGNLDSIIVVNIKAVMGKIREAGINATFQSDKGINIETAGVNFSIEEGAWSKVLNELVTIPSFVEYIYDCERLIGTQFAKDK